MPHEAARGIPATLALVGHRCSGKDTSLNDALLCFQRERSTALARGRGQRRCRTGADEKAPRDVDRRRPHPSFHWTTGKINLSDTAVAELRGRRSHHLRVCEARCSWSPPLWCVEYQTMRLWERSASRVLARG